jgi:hypothetical protein
MHFRSAISTTTASMYPKPAARFRWHNDILRRVGRALIVARGSEDVLLYSLVRINIWLRSPLAKRMLSMATASEHVLEPIHNRAEFTRVNPMPLLVVLPIAERPPPETMRRLNHEYSLAAELEPTWAAKALRR